MQLNQVKALVTGGVSGLGLAVTKAHNRQRRQSRNARRE